MIQEIYLRLRNNNIFILTSYKLYLALLFIVWSKNILLVYIEQFVHRLPVVGRFSDAIIYIFSIICILGAIPHIKKYVHSLDILSFMGIVFVYVVALLWNSEYLSPKFVDFLGIAVPLYFLGLAFNAKSELKLMYTISMITIWCRVLYLLFFEDKMSFTVAAYAGSMSAAYKILPHVCLVIAMAIKKPNYFSAITAIVGGIFVFLCGTRGAVLCIIVFIAIFVLLQNKYKRPLLAYSLAGVAVISIYTFYETIVNWLSSIALSVGMSNRIFLRISEGIFWKSSGRNKLYDQIIEAISKNPIFGYGMGGDYIISETYVHNIVLEFLVSYGVILGSILLGAIIYIVYNGIFKSRDEEVKLFALVLACSTLVKLCLSGTYLDEMYFFFMLGICIGNNRRVLKIKKVNYY